MAVACYKTVPNNMLDTCCIKCFCPNFCFIMYLRNAKSHHVGSSLCVDFKFLSQVKVNIVVTVAAVL